MRRLVGTTRKPVGETVSSSTEPSVELVPLLHSISTAVEEARNELGAAIAELRAKIDGKTKSHYTIEEVAGLTGRAPYTIRAWVKQGRLHAIRVAGTGPKGRLLVEREELQRVVASGFGAEVPATATD